jgi:hypothetical protein
VKEGRISQTALKVALGLITLSIKDDWAERLPVGMVEASERLLLASGSPGYGPGLMRASKQGWMIRVYQIQDRMMPGQWEAFGHRKIFVRFFEVDHPATSAAKAKGVALEGQPPNMIQIAADLGEHSLSKVLAQESDWQDSQPSVLLAEGLLQYLSDEEVHGLLREAADCTPPGSRIIFTHAIPDERKLLQMILRVTGEPFRSAVASADLPAYIEGTGWTLLSEVDDDPAHGIERYAVAERR